MTALEYMEKQLQKHSGNFVREDVRNAPKEVLDNIFTKMLYYSKAIVAIRRMDNLVHCDSCRYHFCIDGEDVCRRPGLNGEMIVTPDGFCAWGESRNGSI